MKTLLRTLAIILITTLAGGTAVAGDSGPTIVTVTGKIGTPNRGPFNAFDDAFFNYHEITFETAHALDRDALSDLGMQETSLKYPDWPREITFRGPRLADILSKAGAMGSQVSVRALDGYAATFDWEAATNPTMILAIEADGQPLTVGGRGPSWLVFPAGVYKDQEPGSDAGLVWSVFHIAVE